MFSSLDLENHTSLKCISMPVIERGWQTSRDKTVDSPKNCTLIQHAVPRPIFGIFWQWCQWCQWPNFKQTMANHFQCFSWIFLSSSLNQNVPLTSLVLKWKRWLLIENYNYLSTKLKMILMLCYRWCRCIVGFGIHLIQCCAQCIVEG